MVEYLLDVQGVTGSSPFVLTKKQAVASAAACFFMKGVEKTDGVDGSKRPVDGCSGRGRVDSGSCRGESLRPHQRSRFLTCFFLFRQKAPTRLNKA